MKDWRGNEYDVGDTVLYAQSTGNHGVCMVEAEVLQFGQIAHTWRGPTPVVMLQPQRGGYYYSKRKTRVTDLRRITALRESDG